MYFLLPPSSAFNSITACAVVPLPAKKSRIMSLLSVVKFKKCFIRLTGFGLSNNSETPNKSLFKAFAALSVLPTSGKIFGCAENVSLSSKS